MTIGQNTEPGLRLGAVRLRVNDLATMRRFYRETIGLVEQETDDESTARLGAGDHPLVELVADPAAKPAPRGSAGLFHLALLVPDRRGLADTITRVVQAGGAFSGASDHLVSEALYLDDPEGNGIEIYRDRPRDEWPRRDGALLLDTLPLDLDALMAERSPDGPDDDLPAATAMGHVHLKVDDLTAARRFYAGILGLDVTVESYPGALFLSAEGYHHHVGLNTWMSHRVAERGTRGLNQWEVLVPDSARWDAIARRSEATPEDGTLPLVDPAGNHVLVVRP